MRTITTGDTGPTVADAQKRLIAAGYPLTPDGIFGPLTEQAVRAYQLAHNLVADGWIGPNTWDELTAAPAPTPEVMGRGSTGFGVKEWQAWLNISGYRAGRADGKYGRRTAAATKRMQRAAGLPRTGAAGPLSYSHFERWMQQTNEPFWPERLDLGDRGSDVRTLQGNLKLSGHDPGPVDGIYGQKTEAGVRAWKPVGDGFDDWEELLTPIVNEAVSRILKIDMPYLSERTLAAAPLIVGWFHGKGDREQAFQDKVHALHICQGESGGHPLMNAIRWGHLSGGKPQGLFAVMTHLRWPTRLGLYGAGETFDPYNSAENARVAGALVYSRSSSWLGFHHWWSVGRHTNPAIEALGLGIRVVWYCPQDPSYWKRVPAGSNFVCNGVNYG